MDTPFDVGSEIGMGRATLRNIIEKLKTVYLGPVGFEYNFIRNDSVREWFFQKCEQEYYQHNPSLDVRKQILSKLNEAVVFENFLHTKFLGQKRFSLEGGENTIPALHTIINKSASAGIREVVIGMAHRGRLNVLVNILGKMPQDLFAEFEGKHADDLPSGDVKYHKGFSSDVTTPGGPVHLTLAFNPSHLEIVNPVVEGSTRARMDRRGDHSGSQVLSVLVHGDAAFAGQGVVMETLNLAQTRHYGTWGTVHLVINNQIGFTTGPAQARSTPYASDIAKMLQIAQQFKPPAPPMDGDAQAVLQASMAETQRRAARDQADMQIKQAEMQQKQVEQQQKMQFEAAMNAENNLTKERIDTLDLTLEAARLKKEQGESAVALQEEIQRNLRG